MGSGRLRALMFAALAAICAIASASLASGYRDGVDQQLGELTTVVVTTRDLDPDKELRPKVLERATELRQVPERFVPTDAFAGLEEIVAREPAAPIPVGSFLVASQFPLDASGSNRGPAVPPRLRPVDLTASGGTALEGLVGGGASVRVDLLVAGEPNSGGNARVEVLARGVPLIALRPRGEALESTEAPSASSADWIATVAVPPRRVVDLVEAENYAREVRVIPR